MPKLRAHVVDAGTFPEVQVDRIIGSGFTERVIHESKGGYLLLDWEVKPDKWEVRTITVSRVRAVQAMTKLAKEQS